MCVDECGVVWWPCLLDSDDTDGVKSPGNSIRVEFAVVVEELVSSPTVPFEKKVKT
jgi:hypothetical protein